MEITDEGGVEADVGCDVAAEALLTFGREVIDIVTPYVPAIKINIAFFEPYYADGIRTYFALVRHASEAGLVVIGDVKRADIGHSCDQYARAQLGARSSAGITGPDAVTVNPYFGFDAIRPFADIARDQGRGVFVLVQTSNQSAVQVQGLALSDGSTLCQRVARIVQSWAMQEGFVGHSNYSCIGAVVSPRDLPSTECIRNLMPNCLFLVPGFGAQGRSAEEVARCFKPDGTGAIVTASRSVIYAYQDARYHDAFGDDWRRCIEQGCKDFVHAIRGVLPS
jgi:orotidine-5'-phosphate decarboxylase